MVFHNDLSIFLSTVGLMYGEMKDEYDEGIKFYSVDGVRQ